MPTKRRNGGRAKHNRGKVVNVRCTNCGGCVPKDKAVKRFNVRNIVDGSSRKDIAEACVYKYVPFALTTGTRVLSDCDIFAELGIEEESNLYADVELLGGGKKRKKKTYTKPKKGHHKKKKFRLAVLKFYKLDASGNVSRLRKECPHNSCGPGVFMAKHEDRTYCGRCGLTYRLVQPAQ